MAPRRTTRNTGTAPRRITRSAPPNETPTAAPTDESTEDYAGPDTPPVSHTPNNMRSRRDLIQLVRDAKGDARSTKTVTHRTWFPFFLEVDRTADYKFVMDDNKKLSKAIGLNGFRPTTSPQDDWAGFVSEFYDFIKPYSPDGVSPSQVQSILEPHFGGRQWARMYEIVESSANDDARTFACGGITSIFTFHCYPLVARVRDYRAWLACDDAGVIAEVDDKLANIIRDLLLDEEHCNYYKLLSRMRLWSESDIENFTNINGGVNEFGAPVYSLITQDYLEKAVTFAQGVQRRRVSNKRTAPAVLPRPSSYKKQTLPSGRATRAADRQTPAPLVTCDTGKYEQAYGRWNDWVGKKSIVRLINEQWNSSQPRRDFQPFRRPAKGEAVSITSRERSFRREHRLCEHCGNHPSGDGGPCVLHPIYADVKRDDGKILGKHIDSSNTVDLAALTVSLAPPDASAREEGGAS